MDMLGLSSCIGLTWYFLSLELKWLNCSVSGVLLQQWILVSGVKGGL